MLHRLALAGVAAEPDSAHLEEALHPRVAAEAPGIYGMVGTSF